jgi:hypothetical protein
VEFVRRHGVLTYSGARISHSADQGQETFVRVALLDMKTHGKLTDAWRRFWNVVFVSFNLDQHLGFGGYQMITSELTIYPYLGNSFLAVSALGN